MDRRCTLSGCRYTVHLNRFDPMHRCCHIDHSYENHSLCLRRSRCSSSPTGSQYIARPNRFLLTGKCDHRSHSCGGRYLCSGRCYRTVQCQMGRSHSREVFHRLIPGLGQVRPPAHRPPLPLPQQPDLPRRYDARTYEKQELLVKGESPAKAVAFLRAPR